MRKKYCVNLSSSTAVFRMNPHSNSSLRKWLLIFILFFAALPFCAFASNPSPFQSTEDLPVAWNGRFCSVESASRLWLYDFYHKQTLKESDLNAFHVDTSSALNLLWLMHFHGHDSWDDSPFFWIHYAELKSSLALESSLDRFSFHALAAKEFHSTDNRIADEWRQLSERLQTFASYTGGQTIENEAYVNYFHELQKNGMRSEEIARWLETRFPLSKRLRTAGTTLKMLPLRSSPGEWVSLHALSQLDYQQESQQLIPVSNFTAFSDPHFEGVRDAYLALKQADETSRTQAVAAFSEAYSTAYHTLAGKPYKRATEKSLYYPTNRQLKSETFYYKAPLVELVIGCYFLALIGMLFTRSSLGAMLCLFVGFALHTLLLALRCYILQRPPVSNMFETIVYVPWIALIIGMLFYSVSRSRALLAAAAFTSLALLILLKLSQVDARMENVQAVLDSQYWLIIHVLMVVGSYGAFAVCGILGHLYLCRKWRCHEETQETTDIAKGILYLMYLGVALLIPGTILGGVWAAESWGRFWDWDPKESWAFITACVYLLIIHAYTFHRIHYFGLAIGSVVGLLAVSFTWYGVNYILGTGLHSYGFGKGGEGYYFVYFAAECVFLTGCCLNKAVKKYKLKKNISFRYKEP